MQVAFLLYDRFTALDAIGPHDVLNGVPATECVFVAERAGPVRNESDTLSLVSDRVVERGKIVTAAGVSSGIDMALALVQRIWGDELAEAVQLGIEYDPEPPLDAGSPEKAPPGVVEAVRAAFAAQSH